MNIKEAEIKLQVDSQCGRGIEKFEDAMRLLRGKDRAELRWNRIGLPNNDTQFVIRVTGSGDRVQAAMLEVCRLTQTISGATA